jgi:hypothetical protein
MKYLVLWAVLLWAGTVSAQDVWVWNNSRSTGLLDPVVELNVDGQDIPILYVQPDGVTKVATVPNGIHDIRLNGITGHHNWFMGWSGGIILEYRGDNTLISFAPPPAPPSNDNDEASCSTQPSSAPLMLLLVAVLVVSTRLAWRRA